jgi:hypothetical protein
MREASVDPLSRVPAQALPAVPMATHVDPTLTAIDRDRIAYVTFAASLNKTDGGKAVLIPEEAAPLFRDDVAPRNGMMPPPIPR